MRPMGLGSVALYYARGLVGDKYIESENGDFSLNATVQKPFPS